MIISNDTSFKIINGLGLGTTLSLLSMFNHIEKDSPFVIYHSTNKFTILNDIVKCCNISPTKIKLVDDLSEIPNCYQLDCQDGLSDFMKFFTPYLNVSDITFCGRKFQLTSDRAKKKVIGLVMHNGTFPPTDTTDYQGYPYNKYYPMSVYHHIINMLIDEYDIITFNSMSVDLETKIYQISQLCDCMIGYEGGIMHLAHILKTPTIILPWHHFINGTTDDWYFFNRSDIMASKYNEHIMHLDEKTYFLDSIDELMSWDTSQFKSIINALHDNKGNNAFLTKKISITQQEKEEFVAVLPPFIKSLFKQCAVEFHIAGNHTL